MVIPLKRYRYNKFVGILQELARSLFVAEGGASAISNTINNICKYDYLLIIRHPVNLNTAAKRGYPASSIIFSFEHLYIFCNNYPKIIILFNLSTPLIMHYNSIIL